MTVSQEDCLHSKASEECACAVAKTANTAVLSGLCTLFSRTHPAWKTDKGALTAQASLPGWTLKEPLKGAVSATICNQNATLSTTSHDSELLKWCNNAQHEQVVHATSAHRCWTHDRGRA